jgi:hypothetical protein
MRHTWPHAATTSWASLPHWGLDEGMRCGSTTSRHRPPCGPGESSTPCLSAFNRPVPTLTLTLARAALKMAPDKHQGCQLRHAGANYVLLHWLRLHQPKRRIYTVKPSTAATAAEPLSGHDCHMRLPGSMAQILTSLQASRMRAPHT